MTEYIIHFLSTELNISFLQIHSSYLCGLCTIKFGKQQDKLRYVLSCFLRYPHLAKTKLEECDRAERARERPSARAVTVVRVPSVRLPLIFQVGAQFPSVLIPRCTEERGLRTSDPTLNSGESTKDRDLRYLAFCAAAKEETICPHSKVSPKR